MADMFAGRAEHQASAACGRGNGKYTYRISPNSG